MNARDFSGTFATALGSTLTSAVGFNTVTLNSAAMLMRYFGVYPAQVTAANVVASIDPYMCVRARLVSHARAGSPVAACAADDALCSRRDPPSPANRYGYQVEVKPTGVATGYTAVKHLAMGRAPWEMVRLSARIVWHAWVHPCRAALTAAAPVALRRRS